VRSSTGTSTSTGAQVEVSNAIYLAGRGVVIVGHVRAGTVRVGQLTAPLVLGAAAAQRLEVSVVERLSSMDALGQAVGIAFRKSPDLNDLKHSLPPGSILLLEEPGEPGARSA
jgi:translation elongation factor EF-Tu-like GTPase